MRFREVHPAALIDNRGLQAFGKLSSLEHILQGDLYPDLYKEFYHKVRIEYYPPRGDAKEGWDNIDIFGWLGYPMQIKINFLCRDSILAAPLVLDLVLFMDLAQRAGMRGIQEWLSFYFKGPMHCARDLPRARHLHPADEAEEYPALDAGRGLDHASGPGILRLVAVLFEDAVARIDHSAPSRPMSGSSYESVGNRGNSLHRQIAGGGVAKGRPRRCGLAPQAEARLRPAGARTSWRTATTPEPMREACRGRRFDVVFDNVYDWERGTTAAQVEATVRACGDRISRYIFMSSVAAYGDGLNHKESDPLAPDYHPDPYVRQQGHDRAAAVPHARRTAACRW